MWNRPSNWKWIAASVLALPALPSLGAEMDAPAAADKNRISLRTRIGLNIEARFSQSGTIKPAKPIGGTGSSLDHYYEDGYVRVDSSGNAGGQTWFWGYDTASQISGNNILFHSTSSTAASSPNDVDNGPQPGMDLVYNREFGTFGKRQQHHWGLEASFGWSGISIEDNRATSANVSRVTDAFAYTPGTTPPPAPYRGVFTGPNFSIFDTPTRTVQSISGAQVHGSREFDGDLIVSHLGPYADFALSDNLRLSVSGGLAVGGMFSQLTWNETVQVPGAAALKRHASGNDGDILIGGFIGTQLEFQIKPRWSATVGFQFESLGDYSQTVAGHKASIDLSKSLYFTLGIGYTF
jgi:hypothetical protein